MSAVAGKVGIPSSARFAIHSSKNVRALLEQPTFDIAKNMLVFFQDPKAVLKARDHTMLLTFDIFPDLAAFSMASIKRCTSKAARPETRGGVPAFNDIAKS